MPISVPLGVTECTMRVPLDGTECDTVDMRGQGSRPIPHGCGNLVCSCHSNYTDSSQDAAL